MSGGSDWQSLRSDGTTTINVRMVMKTDDDALIAMRYEACATGRKKSWTGSLAAKM